MAPLLDLVFDEDEDLGDDDVDEDADDDDDDEDGGDDDEDDVDPDEGDDDGTMNAASERVTSSYRCG